MTLKKTLLLVVVGVALSAPTVGAEEKAEPGTLDKSFKIIKDADIIPVKTKVGSIVIDEIVLNNLPRADEVRIAVANESDGNSRPKIALMVSNPTPFKMKAKLATSFEGEDGTVYMKCDRKVTVKPLEDSDRFNMCLLDSMKTRNWAKVKAVHVVATVGRDD